MIQFFPNNNDNYLDLREVKLKTTYHAKPLVRTAVYFLLPVALLQTVQAQTTDEEKAKQLEKITSTAAPTATTEKKASYTTSSMSTTTGLELTPKETPQSVSVVTKKQINDMGLTNIQDALKNTTGINVIKEGGRYRFQSRGFYMDQIEEDGISSTVPGSSSNAFRNSDSMSDLDIYDRIEVLRGAAGLTQANGEPGGTINAVRKRPTSEFQAQGAVTLGSHQKLRNMVDISGSLNKEKTVRGRVVSVLEKSNSFQNDNDSSKQVLYGVLDIDLTPETVLTVGGLYQNTKDTPDIFGVPMSTTGQDLHLPRSTYLGTDWSEDNFKKYNVFTELTHYLNDDWTLTGKINYIHTESLQKFAALANSAGVGSDNLLAVNNMQNYDNSGDQLSFMGNIVGKYHLFGQQHDVFSTVSFSRQEADSRWKRVMNSTKYNIWTFSPSAIAEPDWNNSTLLQNDISYDSVIYQRAIALGTRLNFTDRLHTLVGGRLTNVSADGGYRYTTWLGAPDNESGRNKSLNKSKLTPYIGITYDLTPETSVYASYTEIFKPQTNTDRNGNILDPVIGDNKEAGIKSAFFDDKLNLSAAIFQITQQNRPMTDPEYSNYSVAQGKVRSRGYELEASGEIHPGWNIMAGYTFNNSKYLKTESTTYPANTNFSKHTPRHMFRLYSNYRLPGSWSKVSVGGGMNVQSDTSSLSNIQQGGYTLWDANLQYEINPHLQLNFVVKNLTDKRYYENQRTRAYGMNNFYGDPRSFLVTLNWKL